jgi:hypothetical protein
MERLKELQKALILFLIPLPFLMRRPTAEEAKETAGMR